MRPLRAIAIWALGRRPSRTSFSARSKSASTSFESIPTSSGALAISRWSSIARAYHQIGFARRASLRALMPPAPSLADIGPRADVPRWALARSAVEVGVQVFFSALDLEREPGPVDAALRALERRAGRSARGSRRARGSGATRRSRGSRVSASRLGCSASDSSSRSAARPTSRTGSASAARASSAQPASGERLPVVARLGQRRRARQDRKAPAAEAAARASASAEPRARAGRRGAAGARPPPRGRGSRARARAGRGDVALEGVLLGVGLGLAVGLDLALVLAAREPRGARSEAAEQRDAARCRAGARARRSSRSPRARAAPASPGRRPRCGRPAAARGTPPPGPAAPPACRRAWRGRSRSWPRASPARARPRPRARSRRARSPQLLPGALGRAEQALGAGQVEEGLVERDALDRRREAPEEREDALALARYTDMRPRTKIACGQSLRACVDGIAEWMPKARAS